MPGNPVHYVIEADEGKSRDNALCLLLKALFAVGRTNGRRFTQFDYEDLCDDYSWEKLDELYKFQSGGAMVIEVRKSTMWDADYLTGGESRIEEVCKMAKKWRSRVLTVFLFPRDSEKFRKDFFCKLDGMSLITISEKLLYDDHVKQVLFALAKENGICSDAPLNDLSERIEASTGYSTHDLTAIFEDWHDTYLKEVVFPQYAKDAQTYSLAKKDAVGSGIEKLHALIGLSETKALVSNILDFAKAQKLYATNGKRKRPMLHMVFKGNPGSAKTTVARLVAQILKENEVVRNGELVEVGRADLVGKYVGHTAPLVKAAFEQALGSVLFIDEAYSLVDGHNGLYGDEAINTIVQEMENRREDVVVIFAGYPDKMEEFISKNPGLRSRISFHVDFPDYSTEELYEILKHLADEGGLHLAEGVRERVLPILARAVGVKEFGNGRYARNLLEQAHMKQASRIVKMAPEAVTEQVFATLLAEDFDEGLPAFEAFEERTVRRIGFV
jgi:hypothetical protein